MPNSPSSWYANFLSHFNLSDRFLGVSLLFTLAIISPASYAIQERNNLKIHIDLERKGLVYARAIEKLLQNIPEHQWKSYRFLNGDTKLKPDLLTLANAIEANFKYLIEVDQEMQSPLKTTSRDFILQNLPDLNPSSLNDQWNEILGRQQALSPELNDELYESLVSNIRLLLRYVGETSELLLDPNLETNFLSHVLIINLPKTQTLIPNMLNLIEGIISKDKASQKYFLRLLINDSTLQTVVKEIKKDMGRTLQDRPAVDTSDNPIETIKAALGPFKNSLNDWTTFVGEVITNIDKETTTTESIDYVELAYKNLESNFSLWESIANQLDLILSERLEENKTKQLYSVLTTFAAAILALIFGLILIRHITAAFNEIAKGAQTIGEGNLNTRIAATFPAEAGVAVNAFNAMSNKLHSLIEKLQTTASYLSKSSSEIARVAKQQETSLIAQETTTKQIANTLQNISKTAKDFAISMNDVSSNAEETSALASSGKAGITEMESIMHQMVDASNLIASKLNILNEKAGNITSVVTTITKVADQTNLLSLNAAIEAEKAGEHGKTFAVIAREVRRLADQTANALLDIERMVNDMVSAVAAGVGSVEKFSNEINAGVNQIGTVGEQLTKIIEQVQRQTYSFEYVNKEVQAQSQDTEEMNNAIIQLSQSAQKASQSIKQFHEAIEQLNRHAGQIQSTLKTP